MISWTIYRFIRYSRVNTVIFLFNFPIFKAVFGFCKEKKLEFGETHFGFYFIPFPLYTLHFFPIFFLTKTENRIKMEKLHKK